MKRRRIAIARSYEAAVQDVWELWTTREGIESWWGPAGFKVEVNELDLRPGGALRYDMIATGAEQIEFMKRAGMPISTPARATFNEVVVNERLGWDNVIDFVPGVGTYDAGALLELRADKGIVHLTLTVEAMHDDTWTDRAVMGWQGELGKLEKLLAARRH